MAFWDKKKKQEQDKKVTPPECHHHWKDFPWYIKSEYSQNGYFSFHVYEPYVCIYCKKRQDKLLYEFDTFFPDVKKAHKFVNEFEEEHKDRLQDQVITEDEIADMQLVDREYLEIYEALKSGQIDKTPRLTL